MTSLTIIGLDFVCIAWVIAVLNDPWTFLVNVLAFMARSIATILFIVPPVYGLVLAMNGVDGILGHVLWAYIAELVGVCMLLAGLFSLRGAWAAMKSVWSIYCMMIALPCWFVLGSIVYFTW